MDITLNNDAWDEVVRALRSGRVVFSTGSQERMADGLADWIESSLWLDDDDTTTLDFDWDGYLTVREAQHALERGI
jgi:hypothetical protein